MRESVSHDKPKKRAFASHDIAQECVMNVLPPPGTAVIWKNPDSFEIIRKIGKNLDGFEIIQKVFAGITEKNF